VTPRDIREYTALRATIRERGTTRIWVFVVGLAVWAALTLAALALAVPPVATLVPLLALAATFEGVFALHVSVERIGRYLLVFHEDRWEQAVGTFGAPAGAPATDALFTVVFVIAAILNLLPLAAASPLVVQETIAVLVPHAAFIARVVRARTVAARQRAVDTERFTRIKND